MNKDNYKVALFLYPEVELLDFAGPGEVFAATEGFEVYTVSIEGTELLSQGFVTIKPEYSLQNAPIPNIVIFPGGGATSPSLNEDLRLWIHNRRSEGAIFMSVCTGARVLSTAGLLDGLQVTTWHGFIPELRTLAPNTSVLENTRFVDNGDIVTTAGVSAGIDGALHLVSRLKGIDVALATARYMEYDKWKPEDGLVNFQVEGKGDITSS